jgi:hypothetical protein
MTLNRNQQDLVFVLTQKERKNSNRFDCHDEEPHLIQYVGHCTKLSIVEYIDHPTNF